MFTRKQTETPANVVQQKAFLQARSSVEDNSAEAIAQRKRLNAINQSAIQRAGEEEEEPVQGKLAAAQLAEEEEEMPVQGKFSVMQRVEEEEEPVQGKLAPVQKQEAPKTNSTGLPDNLKSGVENLSGLPMDDVKVHYNSEKPSQLHALAYAQGTDIHVAPGQEQHLPHEAWHVAQQKQGRVQATTQMKEGVPVNDDKGLEHEADVMGAKAMTEGLKLPT